MIELWVPITLAAAFLQNLRSSLQKHLTARLSTGGATHVRFLYAVPFAAAYAAIVMAIRGAPAINLSFLAWTALGGIAQIAATFALIASFRYRNFAAGTAYSKTEIVQVAVLSAVIMGEPVSPAALLGILTSLIGVLVLTLRSASGGLWRALLSPAALPGLAAGAAFAVSVIAYRSAALSLLSGDFLVRSAATLACVTVFQTVVMGLWLVVREPGEVPRVLRAGRSAWLVGISGMLASACWFAAMTLYNAAYVRALGQVELVFAFASGVLLFGERSRPLEVLGVILIVAGVALLLLA